MERYTILALKSDGHEIINTVIAGEHKIELTVAPMLEEIPLGNRQPANEDIRNAMQSLQSDIEVRNANPRFIGANERDLLVGTDTFTNAMTLLRVALRKLEGR